MIKYEYEAPSKCCPNTIVRVVRHVITSSEPSQKSAIYQKRAKNQQLVTYKALVQMYGTRQQYNVKRVGLIGSNSRIGQAVESVGSYYLPGNLSVERSPIRSTVYGALTPGRPNLNIPRPHTGRDRTARCPEGFQFGGRFTDNNFTTCGPKLFDIPSLLGAAIGAIVGAIRNAEIRAQRVTANPLTPGEYGDSMLESRRPNIPRVSLPNPVLKAQSVENLVRDMGKPDISAVRMVRRDGFVLEPVVSAHVLRSIPDNRDMEGATYILNANSISSLGGEELGLLSNTGVTNLTYVLPGGSTFTLEKVRPLTVGERRKLGRTVNASMRLDNSSNPAARLMAVAQETGDGMRYSENFNIDNPHKVIKGRNGKNIENWVRRLYGGVQPEVPLSEKPTTSNAGISKKITSLEDAVSHIAAGGSLGDISPDILQEALNQVNLFKRTSLGKGDESIDGPNGLSYVLHQPSTNFEHLNAVLVSDVQEHMGVKSPDVFPVGIGDKRPYIVEKSSNVFPGIKPSTDKSFADVSPNAVARLMVSDFLTGVNNRSPLSVDIMAVGSDVLPVAINNDNELTDLADIKIRARTEKLINSFQSVGDNGIYGKYYKEIKKEQQKQFLSGINELIAQARAFNFVNFKERLFQDGKLSDAEKTHLEIVETITTQRLDALEGVMERIKQVLGGRK